MFREICAALILKSCAVPSSHITVETSYIPYAFVDVAVPADSAAPLFDSLTLDLRRSGTIDRDDPGTAMGISAYGEANPARLELKYILPDSSKVSLGMMYPYHPTFIRTPYDPLKTYVVLSLGYRSLGVAKSIVSGKIIQLVSQARQRCDAANIHCSIRARLQEPTKF